MKYTKCKLYKDGDLKGCWTISYKIDGVRALVRGDKVLSRNGKPLYNLDWMIGKDRDVEVFAGTWEETITKVRTKTADQVITPDMVYEIHPNLDERLYVGDIHNPTEQYIYEVMRDSLHKKYEGLVLRQGNKWLKVKPSETFDVKILDVIEGTGKYVGMMGALMTSKGKVGTGFTDKQRIEYFDHNLIGQTIEVECMEITKDGMFRHPRFLRIRWDK